MGGPLRDDGTVAGAAADGAIEGITADQFTVYFGLVLVTTALSFSGVLVYEFSPLVHDGRLADYLVRPYHPYHNLVAQGLSWGVFRAPTVAVLFALVLAVLGGSVRLGLTLPLAVALWLAGVVGAGYLAALAGTIALWVTKSYGLQSVVIGLEGLIGGLYAPIRLLPAWLEPLGHHNPFWFQVGAPSELLAGILDRSAGVAALLEALVWIAVLHVVFRAVWKRGVRQYELVGG